MVSIMSGFYGTNTHPLTRLCLYVTGYIRAQHILYDFQPNKLIRITSIRQPKPCFITSYMQLAVNPTIISAAIRLSVKRSC